MKLARLDRLLDETDLKRLLGAGTSMAIHFGTFRLADDGEDLPAERIRAALDVHSNPAPRSWVPGFGEGRDIPPA